MLRYPEVFVSASAFNPIQWDRKALRAYIDQNVSLKDWKASKLVDDYAGQHSLEILIDEWYTRKKGTLPTLPTLPTFVEAANNTLVKWTYNWHENYDNSYLFIATFIAAHFDHHAKFLKPK